MADMTAAELLRQFEGFRSTAYWDKNAWRIGYGSDTMTDANGNVVRVTKDSTTTREAAERDLARRIPEFQKQGIIPYVGKDNWDRLPQATKAAVTSVAYNYGSLDGLTSLTKAIKSGDSDAMAAALKKYAAHNDGENAKRRLAEAKIVLGAPIPKAGMATDGTLKLQQIQDKKATAQGYGELPPIPANMPPALQAARTRLAAARQQIKDTTAAGLTPAAKLDAVMGGSAARLSDPLKVGAAGLSVTPRLPSDLTNVTEAQRKAATANLPQMDVSPVQARAIILDEGLGSLMNPRSVSPGAITRPPVSTNANLNLARSEQAVQRSLAPQVTPLTPPVPLPRDARPQTATTSTETKTATVAPKMVRLDSGKMAKVGETAVLGGNVWTVQDNGDGTGKMVKAAPSILKEMNANTVAGGVVREKVGEAIGGGKQTVVEAAKPVLETVTKAGGDLLGQAGNFLGGLFSGASVGPADNGLGIKLSVPLDKPKAGTTLAIPAVAAPQAAALSAPGAGLTAAQRNAMTSLAGTGMSNALAPIPATMPPGLRGNALPTTPKANPITVAKPASPSPAAAQPTQKLYQAGGYIYAANPQGGYTKVGKVQSGGGSSAASTIIAATTRPASSSGSSSSSSSVPKGYTDLGNGKFQSDSGGIYYSRNL